MARGEHLIGVTLQGDLEAIDALNAVREGITGQVLGVGMYGIVENVAAIVRENAPVWTSALVDDIDTEVIVGEEIVEGEVFSTLFYTPYQEYGWKEGTFPNVSNLEAWAYAHDIDPRALARSLYNTGGPSHEQMYFYAKGQAALERWIASTDFAGLDGLLRRFLNRIFGRTREPVVGRSWE